jgi:hypothetical protein
MTGSIHITSFEALRSAYQIMTPPNEGNDAWRLWIMGSRVDDETYPLPAAVEEAGTPRYTLMFLFPGEMRFAQ